MIIVWVVSGDIEFLCICGMQHSVGFFTCIPFVVANFSTTTFRFLGLCGRLCTTRANAFPNVALLLYGNVCEGVRSVDSCSLFARHLRVAWSPFCFFTRFSSGDILFIQIPFLNLSLSLYRVCLSGSFLIRSRYSRMRSLALLPMVWLIYC